MARQKNRHSLLRLVVTLALAFLSLPLLQSPAHADIIGGFEVDGNQITETNIDWQTLAGVDVVTDPVGNADASVFDGGDSEGDNDGVGSESPWDIGSPGTPSGKSDIGNILVSDYKLGGDTYAAFAWDRAGDTGTGRYYIELNQQASAGIMPNRTNGDFRIIVAINGSDLLECVSVETWSGQWGNAQACGATTFKIVVNDATIADFFSSPNAPLEANTFLEGVLNLSDFGLTTCPVTGFQSIHLRSQEGGETGDTSRLKDFGTGPVTIDSDCGALKIVKNASNGGSGAGAVFLVDPNPTPGQPDQPPIIVTAGADGTFTIPAAEPGTYTVRELAPPDGYLLPANDTQVVTIGVAEKKTVTFNDVLGDVSFTKSYEGSSPTGCGASFTLTRDQKWSYDINPAGGFAAPVLVAAAGPSMTVTDNCTNDTDGDIGQISVANLPGGHWTIEEDSAPAGWIPDADTVDFTVGPTDAPAERSISLNAGGNPATFQDPLRKITIEVLKTESVPGIPGDTKPLAGVTFELYADNNGAPGALVDTDVTDADGRILFTGLSWQQDYWLKEIKKPGYEIGLSPNPKLIDIDQSNPPTNNSTVITVNVDNPREEVSIKLNKVDGTDQSPLDGGEFNLYRESNNTAGLQIGSDTLVNGSPETLVNGSLTFDQTEYQIPWGYTYYVHEAAAPTGYGLMTPNPIVVPTTAGQADTTITLNATDPRLPVKLKLVKIVDNSGTDGTAVPADWTLSANGPTPISGAGGTALLDVDPGTYTLSEALTNPPGPDGYSASQWNCVGNGDNGNDGTVALELGDSVTCTIINKATSGTWTVVKTADPPSGSTVARGQLITYTITATKTGGVDPVNVLVVDDLAAVLNHAALEGPIVASSGTAVPVGDTIDWTIPVLSGTETLTYSVRVDDNDAADGVALRNHVTSEGSSNCPPNPQQESDDCTTEHFTPHYTLEKSSVPPTGSVVNPGDPVTYTLTVTNDGPVPLTSATVTDNLSDVLDNATLQLPLASGLTQNLNTLTWVVPTPLAPGASVSVSYTVIVHAGAWNATLHNVATPGDDYGDCVTPGGCQTTHTTPPVTTLVIKKVDMERNDVPLAGAEFSLFADKAPLAGNPPVVGPEDLPALATATTGADGLAKFPNLRPGRYLVKETKAPAGYDLLKVDTIVVEIVEGPGGNFVPSGEMAPILFRDPAQGQIAIVAKRQYELINGAWVESDGKVKYGDTVKYVVGVQATGPKLFHNVRISDYVPGYNPADTTSTAKGQLVAGSPVCTGSLVCSVSVEGGLVTWNAGTVTNAGGTVEMLVKFPSLPKPIPFDDNNEFTTTLWNIGYLDWDEVVVDTITPVPARSAHLGRVAAAALPMVHHRLTSNEVIVRATVTNQVLPNEEKKPKILPQTGVSGQVQTLGLLGALGVMVGGMLMLSGRRSRG